MCVCLSFLPNVPHTKTGVRRASLCFFPSRSSSPPPPSSLGRGEKGVAVRGVRRRHCQIRTQLGFESGAAAAPSLAAGSDLLRRRGRGLNFPPVPNMKGVPWIDLGESDRRRVLPRDTAEGASCRGRLPSLIRPSRVEGRGVSSPWQISGSINLIDQVWTRGRFRVFRHAAVIVRALAHLHRLKC